jgi:phosphatidylglycerophosphatase A
MTRLALLICTVGGLGYAPVAPGTAGSLAGLAIYAAFRELGLHPALEALALLLLIWAGAWSGTIAERHLGTKDPGAGVIDEVAGMLVTLFLLPASWTLAIVGFFVFRTLDIVKPFPARRLESLPGGWGMMADDLMAAVYANLVLRLAIVLVPADLLR